jgi:hypothetical protein
MNAVDALSNKFADGHGNDGRSLWQLTRLSWRRFELLGITNTFLVISAVPPPFVGLLSSEAPQSGNV